MEWSDEYSVGIDEMDKQHRQLFRLLSEFEDAIRSGKEAIVIGPVVDKLFSYTKTHFVKEEKLMRNHSYPDLESHKKAHADMVEQVEDLYQRSLTNGGVMKTELLGFIADWLLVHIIETDKKYSLHIKGKDPCTATNL